MNKIEKLISELCPDGVEFKELGGVCEFKKGKNLTKNNIVIGGIPVIAWGRKPISFHNESNRQGELVTISSSWAYSWFVSFWNEPIFLTDAFSVIPLDINKFNTKYIFYFLKNNQEILYKMQKWWWVPHVYAKDVSKIKIPFPDIKTQQEIVKILDNFTQLEAELEAELEGRKKQYEYYRDEMLSFGEDVEWKTVDDACLSIKAGWDLPKNYLKGQKKPTEEFPYPIYSNWTGSSALYWFTDSYKIENEAVTISARGTIGYHTIRKPNFTPIVRLITCIPNNEIVTTKFLNYVLDKTEIGHSGWSIPQLTTPNVKKLKIPVPFKNWKPDLEKQKEIVKTLDKFDKLVNDISEGLPAEIEARKQQYEYYRNKLLTFKELEK